MQTFKVFQDGRDFYDDVTGNRLYRASIKVKDFDIEQAVIARKEFEEFANKNDWAVFYVSVEDESEEKSEIESMFDELSSPNLNVARNITRSKK